jgi:hypothetical protein
MEIKLPSLKSHEPDWNFIDGILMRWADELPPIIAKKRYKNFLCRKMNLPDFVELENDEKSLIRRLYHRSSKIGIIKPDPERWRRMLIVEKPQNKMIVH